MVNVAIIVGAVVLAIVAGLIIFKLVKLTIDLIKKFRKRKDTKEALVQMKTAIGQMAKDPKYKHIKFSDLNEDAVIVAEVDDNGEIVGEMECYDKIDQSVEKMIDEDGVIIIED